MKNTNDIAAEQQQQHRQERTEALLKSQKKKAFNSICYHIGAAVIDVFPELSTNDALDSGKLSDEALARIDDIKLVLQYFATHPRILTSLRSGILSSCNKSNV